MDTLTGQLEAHTTQPAPRLDVFLPPEGKRNGTSLVIFPGGGYHVHAPHEGAGYAEFFRREGFACFVVSYRLGTQGFRHPAMLEDGLAAIAAVRGRAAELGLRPDRVGVMGSSAGGHLAAHTLVAWDAYRSSIPLRPDFGILCYPVIDMRGDVTHTGSRDRLIGPSPSPERIAEVDVLARVAASTPPCFLWHTGDDSAVPVDNSLLFAAALRKQGVPFELHIYPHGRHGLGLDTDLNWGACCVQWLQRLILP